MTKENNEIKRAVAMAYSPEDGAPRIVAKGSGVTAEAIISLAREHGVYVHKSEELVQLLMQVDLDLGFVNDSFQTFQNEAFAAYGSGDAAQEPAPASRPAGDDAPPQGSQDAYQYLFNKRKKMPPG